MQEETIKTRKDSKGFTLIELLVVVTIIGILAAIAIPQFASYRQRSFDARANSDLRNAATFEEAYYATNQSYVTCTSAGPGGGCDDPALPGMRTSATVTVTMTGAAGNNPSFTGTSTSSSGSNKVFKYNSTLGGMQ